MSKRPLNRWLAAVLLGAILLAAAALRLTGLGWDDYLHFHPDERYITWVATSIEWPADGASLLDPKGTLNPFYWPSVETTKGIVVPFGEVRRFAYGHVPLYAGVIATKIASAAAPALVPLLPPTWTVTRDVLNGADWVEFNHLTAVGRFLTALIDVGSVWLLFALGRRQYGMNVGLLAAALLAVNVMHIQLAHFFTTDPYMTFFILAALWGMVTAVWEGKIGWLMMAAIFTGLAIGSKFSAILLVLPLALSVWFLEGRRLWARLLVVVAAVFAAFALTNPFALLDNSCEVITPPFNLLGIAVPALDWRSCYLDNIASQSAMVRGGSIYPFVRQYAYTRPFLYFVEMQLRWGMGWLLGSVAFIGLVWALAEGAKLWRGQRLTAAEKGHLILLAWVVPYFISTGNFYVKFMRYMQPITPLLVLFGAAWLWRIRRPLWRNLLLSVVVVGTALYALAFVQMYRAPHPWTAASAWIYANVPQGAVLAVERWDQPLPSSMQVNGVFQRSSQYGLAELQWLVGIGERDDAAKLADNLEKLSRADYAIIASNRIYGVTPRLPDAYPLSGQFHQLLFDGALGYELVYVVGRFPNLGGVRLYPDSFSWPQLQPPAAVAAYVAAPPSLTFGRADESFTVYDQPLTLIFANKGHLSAEVMAEQFDPLPR